MTLGERGPFYSMQQEFSRYFDRVDVLCPRPPGEVSVRLIHENVHLHPAQGSRIGMVRYISGAGSKLLDQHKHELIVSHDYGWFYNGIGSAFLARHFGIPYVSELHHVPGVPVCANLRERFDRSVARLYVRWARNKARAFRVVNQEEMPQLLRGWGVPQERIAYLPSLYIDTSVFCPDSNEGAQEAYRYDVIFVGRMVVNKGIGRIVDALSILQRRGLSARAVFVGRGPMAPAIKARVRAHELDVTFLDWVAAPEDLADLYRASRVCVCGSTCEGGPRFTVEAMACGTPVVSTPVGVMSELLGDSQAGGLCGWDPHFMANALERVLSNEKLRLEMGRHALELAQAFEYKSAIGVYANGLRHLAGHRELQR